MISELNERPFIKNPLLNEIINLFDFLRHKNTTFGEISCLLLTGESGSGKSELAKHYLKANPVVHGVDRKCIPVVHFELKSIATPDEFLRSLLVEIGDPQLGLGAKNKGELFRRVVTLLNTIKCELLILDEIQVIMERRSAKVVTGLADLFKDLIKNAGVPIVFMGMPWSRYLVDSNEQLAGRISYRHVLPPYRISTPQFRKGYRSLLKLLGDAYGISTQLTLESSPLYFRFFCFSNGNLRTTANLINDVYIKSKMNGEKVGVNSFADIIRSYGISEDLNPFLLPIEKLVLRELIVHSDWNFGYRANKNSIVDAEYAEFGITTDEQVYSLMGAA